MIFRCGLEVTVFVEDVVCWQQGLVTRGPDRAVLQSAAAWLGETQEAAGREGWNDGRLALDRYVRVYRNEGGSWRAFFQRTFPAHDRGAH